jgi:hypothetical protein
MNPFWGSVHFWITFLALNYVFFNMLGVGYAGQHRRLFDPSAYDFIKPLMPMNRQISIAAFILGAAEAASAEGIQRVSETVEFSTVPGTQPGTPGAGTILVPNGKVAVVRHWAAQPDDGGYFRDSSTGLPVVQFSLAIDGNRQIFSPALAGNHGTLADPFDVSYVIPEGQTIAVVAKSTDEDMWHLVETYFDGYFIEVQDINETLRAIDGRGTC